MTGIAASPRRGFLALVGAAFSSIVQPVRAAQRRTLPLPTAANMPPPSSCWPLLSAEPTRLHAFMKVSAGLPDWAFEAWLEDGLWTADRWTRRAGA